MRSESLKDCCTMLLFKESLRLPVELAMNEPARKVWLMGTGVAKADVEERSCMVTDPP